MKRTWIRVSYVVVAVGLAVCCLAAVRPDIFGISQNSAKVTKEDGTDQTNAEPQVEDALSQFVLEREQLRSMQLSQLEDIINSAESSQELVDSAQTEKIEILRRMEIEQTIAGILKSRGYLDAAVAASKDTVNVMIRKSEITQEDTAIVMELVLSETDVDAGDVKIIPIN